MLKITCLLANTDCEFSRKKKTDCALVSREGFPDQRIALSKLQEALRLIVPMQKTESKKKVPEGLRDSDGGRNVS